MAIVCGFCGAALSAERVRLGARYCHPSHQKSAEKRRWRARRGPRTEAGIYGFKPKTVCQSHCTHPDAAARLHVAAVVLGSRGGGRISYAKGWRYCRTCEAWFLSPERRFCPCCEATLHTKPTEHRKRYYDRHPELAPPEIG